MNIEQEKIHLYTMMQEITMERRQLTNLYFSLKERMDELNKLELKGVSELSTKGFFDMFNDRETNIQITNINREAEHMGQLASTPQAQVPRYDKSEAMLQQGLADRAANAILRTSRELEAEKERVAQRKAVSEEVLSESARVIEQLKLDNYEKQSTTLPPPEEVTIPLDEIERAKEKDSKNAVVKKRAKSETRGKQVKFKVLEQMVIDILKEAGVPVRSSKIYEELNKKLVIPLTKQNFAGNVMYRVKKQNPKVDNIKSGYYQYKY